MPLRTKSTKLVYFLFPSSRGKFLVKKHLSTFILLAEVRIQWSCPSTPWYLEMQCNKAKVKIKIKIIDSRGPKRESRNPS